MYMQDAQNRGDFVKVVTEVFEYFCFPFIKIQINSK